MARGILNKIGSGDWLKIPGEWSRVTRSLYVLLGPLFPTCCNVLIIFDKSKLKNYKSHYSHNFFFNFNKELEI